MEKRLAVISIILDSPENSDKVNALLHEKNEYIVGRMGIPYKDRGVSVITVVIDAPLNDISSLSGKLGMLDGITVKAIYSKEK